jgi:DNA polymerase III subunit delta'
VSSGTRAFTAAETHNAAASTPGAALQAPWLADALSALEGARAVDRMPHALLIDGGAGTGAGCVAMWAAQLVLCASAHPCGQCQSCRRVESGQHPDLTLVRPAEDSKQIRVDQVRELCAELALTSHQGGYKVAIIEPADTLNRAAANALLKTLEEPQPRTLLVLVAAAPSRLPATLVSRCQRIHVRRPSRKESLAWLERMRGPGQWNAVLDVMGEAPLAAAGLDPAHVAAVRSEVSRTLDALCAGTADPVAAAEHWSRTDLEVRLACLENWLTDRIRHGLGVPTHAAELRTTAHSRHADSVYKTYSLFARLDEVRGLKAALAGPINRSLALESLLRSITAAGAAVGRGTQEQGLMT